MTSTLARSGVRAADITAGASIALQMARVADLYLDATTPLSLMANEEIWLRQMMERSEGRDAFGGLVADDLRPFRLLAWDAARNLIRDADRFRCRRWARIMDEAIGALPEHELSIG